MRNLGNQAEEIAKHYLLSSGLLFVKQQYRITNGEIDLIMRDAEDLIFIEVRYRQGQQYGNPLETITKTKQQRILRTAMHFCLCNPWTKKYNMRFDAISILDNLQTSKITWIQDAFRVE